MDCEDGTMDNVEQVQEQQCTGNFNVVSDLCRICAEESTDIIHIFGEQGTDLQLVDKIHIHLPIMVTKTDVLPLNVCKSCVSKLELCHETVLSCLEADAKLKLMFGIDPAEQYAGLEMSENDVAEEDYTTSEYTFSILNPENKTAYKTAIMKLKNSAKNGMVQNTVRMPDTNESNFQIENDVEMLKQEDEIDYKTPELTDEYVNTEVVDVTDYAAAWEELEYICYYCEAGIMGKANFMLHQSSVHQNQVFSCPMCELVFELEAEFKQHLATHMEEEEEEEEYGSGEDRFKIKKQYQCSSCFKIFATKLICLQHSCNTDTIETNFECPMCDRKFSVKSALSAHMKRHKGIFTCRVCLKVFANRGALLLHRRGHSREELLGLDVHNTEEVKVEGDLKGAKCPICEEVFPTKEKMELHFPVHTETSYPCYICGKILSKKNTLEYHLRTHTGEKPFVCRQCPSAFQSRIGLIVHERKHTGEKPYKCSECDMAFRCRATLNQHKIIHSDRRPFTCSHCGRGFRRRDTLETHVRTHTNERPYACTICGRAFRQKGDCNKHERTHERKVAAMLSTEEPCITFSCSICHLEVTEQEDLDDHLQTHHASEGTSTTVIMVNTRGKPNEKLQTIHEEKPLQ